MLRIKSNPVMGASVDQRATISKIEHGAHIHQAKVRSYVRQMESSQFKIKEGNVPDPYLLPAYAGLFFRLLPLRVLRTPW